MTWNPGPAGLSHEARAWLTRQAALQPPPEGLSLDAQRSAREALYAPAAHAAAARHGVSVGDVTVGGRSGLELTPTVPRSNATLIYLHGGGFVFGSPTQDLTISAALAAKTGLRVLSPSYRLAPEDPYPAAVDDVEAVARAVLEDTAAPVALVGESAGASLALAATLRLRQGSGPQPAALALMSPATDLNDFGDSYLTARDPILTPDRLDVVPRTYAPDADLNHPDISPIYGEYDPAFPPSMISTGTRDLLLSSCVRQARVMRDAGAAVTLRVWEGMWHAFEFYDELPEADASLSEVAAFLSGHVG